MVQFYSFASSCPIFPTPFIDEAVYPCLPYMPSQFSHVWLFSTLWAVACQAPLSMRFSMQGYCSGLPFPSPEDLPGIEPGFPALQVGSLPLAPTGKPMPPLLYINWPHKNKLISGISIPLIYVSCFVPVPSCFDYHITIHNYHSVVWNQGLIWSALFFFKIALANWCLLCFHKNFRIIYSSLVKNIFDILVGIALNL